MASLRRSPKRKPREILTHIRALGVDVDEETRAYIRRKLNRKLRKFASSIVRVSIRLTDVNGPRGGVDQLCRIKITLKGSRPVVFENQDDSVAGAFGGALTGVERNVDRFLQRKPRKRARTRMARVAAA